ncbi:predicted protein [Phaeodactylum tricornutum CCAP 1055/1]|jgi:hypothetical protein|uniref:Vacuolar protein 8 n=1 Tax=Phaeodactylum tricornutum (strain CCAP 1055/1) TaxID=556484 RepID=B5Y4L5_PHATC|nr:predicted protein [Phaeodactylum tricornutum CCAP 1055/1]ACI65503.1 predicted protein [Phaeodactylum tricornutum CCAP 1055/1]|eukprot:XP_002186033.1 predicted protein [Phaeodactylum tricornutum CCAP 1055/1]
MANAMLQADSVMSSHTDLLEFHSNHEYVENDASTEKKKTSTAGRIEELAVLTKELDATTMTTPNRKTVEFAVQPPPHKRARPTTAWTAKQVVDAISTSIAPAEREEAIQKAREAFDHEVQVLHDDEMASGADSALAKHLTFLVWHQQENNDHASSSGERSHALSTEIAMTCEALEGLYRASSSIVGASFERMGRHILSVLVHILKGELRSRSAQYSTTALALDTKEKRDTSLVDRKTTGSRYNSSDDDNQNKEIGDERRVEEREARQMNKSTDMQIAHDDLLSRSLSPPMSLPGTPEGDLFLLKATRIIGHFARVGAATQPIAHHPGLIGSLIHLVTFQPRGFVPWEARLSALWTLANLACNEENMQMMVSAPGLMNCLIEVACRPLHPGDSLEHTMEILRSRSLSSRAILNLSWLPGNKIVLSEHAALLDLLCELAVHRATPLKRSRTIQDVLVTTRRYSVGALRNLAAAPRRTKIGLCEYKNGHLLDKLTDAALNDSDTAVKDRAFAAIHNLAIRDTAEKIVNHPALVLALKDVLLSGDGEYVHEEGSPKSHASATLMVLERTITPDMDSYENLKDLLEAVNPTSTTDDSVNSSNMEVNESVEV